MKKIFSIFFVLVLVLSMSLVTAVPAMAATEVWVDDDFTSATPGWGTTHFDKIQDGIDAVDPDGTVHVAAGTYTENILVGKSLTITGAGAAKTTIDGGGSGIVVLITASNVTVSGFTITGSGGPSVTEGGVGLLNVTGCTIEDNIISNNAGIGIGLQGGSGNTIENNTLDSNHIAGIGLLGSGGNTIERNTSTGTIEVILPLDPDNYVGYGIWLEYGSAGNTINGNKFSGNEIDGVYFGHGSDGNTLTNNIITNNGKVAGVDAHGVYFWMSGGNTVTGNTIAGNLASGIHLYQSTGNTINYNNIFNNTNYGIYTDTAVDALYNWWGNPRGPCTPDDEKNPGGKCKGKGDSVSTGVDYDPWLHKPVVPVGRGRIH